MKLFIFLFFFVFISLSFADIHYSIESFHRETDLDSRSEQRNIVRYEDEKSLGLDMLFNVTMEFQYSFINSVSHISQENNDEFTVHVQDFFLLYQNQNSILKNDIFLTVGVQECSDSSFLSQNINAPGIELSAKQSEWRASSGYFLIPSNRKFFISQKKDYEYPRKQTSLWSSSFSFDLLKDSLYKTNILMNYDYYSNLDNQTAFQSGLRGNSSVGDEITSEFLYDYSIPSFALKFIRNFGKWDSVTSLSYGKNISAPDDFSDFFKISSGTSNEKVRILFSYLKIERDSMISLFTDEVINQTDVKGYLIDYLHNFREDFSIGFILGSFQKTYEASYRHSFNLFLKIKI